MARLGLQRVRRRGGPQALSCGRGAQALASLTECPCVCGDRVGTWVGHEWVWAWWFEAGLCIHLGIRVYSRVFNLRAGKVQNTRIHLAILVYSTCRVLGSTKGLSEIPLSYSRRVQTVSF